jgi:hypothetical protein
VCVRRFLFLVSLAQRQECRGSLNQADGFQMEHRSPRFVGFLQIVGVDEGLVDGETVFGEVGVAGVASFGIEADLVAGGVVGVELLEEAP